MLTVKIDQAKFSPGQVNIKQDVGKTDPRDSMISYVYYIGQCFELRICLMI